jgi:ribosomal protein S25
MRPKKGKSKVRKASTRAQKSIAKKKRPPTLAAKMASRRAPIVEDTIIDVVDKPVPGVVRVTEYETVRITTPKQDADSDADK